jgi:hypothetical protein
VEMCDCRVEFLLRGIGFSSVHARVGLTVHRRMRADEFRESGSSAGLPPTYFKLTYSINSRTGERSAAFSVGLLLGFQ